MKYVNGILLATILTVISVFGFLGGRIYEAGVTVPQVVTNTEVVTEEVVVIQQVEEAYDTQLILGLTIEGNIEEAKEETEYLYKIIIDYNRGDSFTEAVVWVPVDQDSFAGIRLTIPSDEYRIRVVDSSDKEMESTEGDQF